MTLKAVIIVGLAQMVALMPGISRSGATIVAALAVGWSRDLALRFSFYLSPITNFHTKTREIMYNKNIKKHF